MRELLYNPKFVPGDIFEIKLNDKKVPGVVTGSKEVSVLFGGIIEYKLIVFYEGKFVGTTFTEQSLLDWGEKIDHIDYTEMTYHDHDILTVLWENKSLGDELNAAHQAINILKSRLAKSGSV